MRSTTPVRLTSVFGWSPTQVTLERDEKGRIIKATDPKDVNCAYRYDQNV